MTFLDVVLVATFVGVIVAFRGVDAQYPMYEKIGYGIYSGGVVLLLILLASYLLSPLT